MKPATTPRRRLIRGTKKSDARRPAYSSPPRIPWLAGPACQQLYRQHCLASAMLAAGLAGYFLEKVNVPLAPIILGMILGPMAEQSVRRALLISRGDATELLTRPISAALALATLLVIAWPIAKAMRRRRGTKAA